MHLQSDSERELTDLCTSLFWHSFPLHLFCGAQFCLSTEHILHLECRAGAAGCFVFPVCDGGFCRLQAVHADAFPCSLLFVNCCDLKCFERVTFVVSVLCHWWQHPLTLAMSGRGSRTRKASLRDLSDLQHPWKAL